MNFPRFQTRWSSATAVALLITWVSSGGPMVCGVEPKPASQDSRDKEWRPLFEFEAGSLKDWKATNFGGEGGVTVDANTVILGSGSPLTGITRTEGIPNGDYEIELQAQRIEGRDFFCALTLPVQDSHCSLVVGGWGGSLVGISCLDGEDASENDTTTFQKFEQKKWYTIRMQVTSQNIIAWIDDEKVVDRNIEQTKISVRIEVDASRPLGIASYETRAGLKDLRWRPLVHESSAP